MGVVAQALGTHYEDAQGSRSSWVVGFSAIAGALAADGRVKTVAGDVPGLARFLEKSAIAAATAVGERPPLSDSRHQPVSKASLIIPPVTVPKLESSPIASPDQLSALAGLRIAAMSSLQDRCADLYTYEVAVGVYSASTSDLSLYAKGR